ncbi:condensation domain-containing protein [Streptosporangium sp. NPDC000396]|uniref:condensation domain-containing protein n=1 Tax=Streptosporangium sp. NPDC000396 TaxID=3366185 RepID=UPI003689C045
MSENPDPVLSLAQQRLWFLEQFAPGSPQYNVAFGYDLRGPLDVEALRRALSRVHDRHDALRMNFLTEAGRPRVVIHDTPYSAEIPLEELTWSGDDPGGWERAATEYAIEWAARPFDIARDPLLKAQLLRVGPDRHIFLLVVHHMVVDAWSAQIIDVEIGEFYSAEVSGVPVELPLPKAGYADYAVWQREMLGSPKVEKNLRYWREHLDGAPELITLPIDRPRPRVQTFNGAEVSFPISYELGRSLRDLARAERVTLFQAAYAAFAVLIGRYARTADVVTGVTMAGRSRPEFASTVGFFISTLPVRTRLADDPSFRTIMKRARNALFGALEHDLLPFDILVDRLGAERDLSYNPLVQIVFNMLHAPPYGVQLRWHDLEVHGWGREVTQPATRFDLEVHLSEAPELADADLDMLVCYNTDLFDRATAEGLADTYRRLLAAVCANPDLPLSHIHRELGGAPADAQVTVRDGDGVVLPRGVVGELWITGVAGPERTGLLARMRGDGELELYGAADAELHMRGCRVPAKVVEDAIVQEPDVATARVRNADTGLAAHLTPAKPGAPRPADADLRARLRRRLPPFLVPATFEWEGEEPPPPDEPLVFIVTPDAFGDAR